MHLVRLNGLLRILLFSFLIGTQTLFGQNLVPNPDFNDFTWCPGGRGLLGWAVPWYSPNRNTSDFCHSCSGSPSYSGVPDNRWGIQDPYAGEGYAGIRTWISTEVFVAGKNYREYLAVELTDTLRKGDTYFLSFQLSVGDNAGYFSDDIGMFLSPDTIASDTILTFSPQLANADGNVLTNMDEWIEIAGQFVAEGGERFLVIGNFKVDEETTLIPRPENDTLFKTTYFFIDEVKVEPCKARFPETLLFAEDSLICEGESIRLAGVAIDSATYEWEDGSTEVIRQINQANTYQLSISLNGCTRTDSIKIGAIKLPEIQLGADTTLCPGASLLLEVEAGAESYLWSDQSTGTELQVNEPGSYEVRAQTGKCINTDVISISYEEDPGTLSDQQAQKCSDQEILLTPSVQGLSYVWQDLNPSETYIALRGGTYYVDIESYCFLVRETFLIEDILCSCESEVANVFSPNGDGVNDVFIPQLQASPSQYKLDIFDRYGRAIFSSTNPETGWEGRSSAKNLKEGVYYWSLQYTCLEGGEDRKKVKTGFVSLLR